MICIVCEERPAKVIEAKMSNGAVYVQATKEPVFCTLRCAAAYALLWVEGLEDHPESTLRKHRQQAELEKLP
jgi:hypothetical protein